MNLFRKKSQTIEAGRGNRHALKGDLRWHEQPTIESVAIERAAGH